MTELTVPTILNTAADLIEERGWTQGDYENRRGCLCLIGAIRVAINGTADWPFNLGGDHTRTSPVEDACNAVRAVLGPTIRPWADGIPRWNDDNDRTQQEVVDTLRAAAKAAEQVPA